MTDFLPARLALILALLLCFLLPATFAQGQTVRLPAAAARAKAREFPADFTWLNTDQPLRITGNLKGHILILDFWTYCCINCMHILPDLEFLETKYAGQPVAIIGVHSAKFETEADADNIKQAIQRYRIQHPVIVDQNHKIWNTYGVRAWPSFVIIDSAGRFVGQTQSEGQRELLDEVVAALLKEGKENGTLAQKPIQLKPTAQVAIPAAELAFPGKVVADGKSRRLFIADSNHDRILVSDLSGKVSQIIGSGAKGLKDGSLTEAQFSNPQGMAVDGNVIYVADTDNHALRRIDLDKKVVTTLAGDGKRSYDREGGAKGTAQGLASPWDLQLLNGKLYIANAGTHQIWTYELESGVAKSWSGSGRENIVDGGPDEAALAQPSGLALLGDQLYFADSEVSAVRKAALADGKVETLIGEGLFEFGHKDGAWSEAKLQHCLGVAVLDGNILVADTYNSALRLLDLKARTITTLLGGPGAKDLDEPGGLSVLDGIVYLADTNHHRIVRFDPKTKKADAIKMEIPVK